MRQKMQRTREESLQFFGCVVVDFIQLRGAAALGQTSIAIRETNKHQQPLIFFCVSHHKSRMNNFLFIFLYFNYFHVSSFTK